MEKHTFDPGAAPYGNFINYYSFNSVDERIKAIPDSIWKLISNESNEFHCLDVGCNAGDLTVALYQSLKKSEAHHSKKITFLGIDLDETLIVRSMESNPCPSDIKYYHLDIMDDSSSAVLYSHLGFYDKTCFDLVTCFSTTMWIHLHYGDNGLHKFLSNISKFASYILIEPQEWKCYQRAARRIRKGNSGTVNLDGLKERKIAEYISKTLSEQGMKQLASLGTTSWNRELYLFGK